MTAVFSEIAPATPSHILSTDKNTTDRSPIYLHVKDDSLSKDIVFEIYTDYFITSFMQALRLGSLLAIGLQDDLFLFDLAKEQLIRSQKMSWYFSHLYANKHRIYAASAWNIICIDQSGVEIWKSPSLGIDGVIVHSFGDGYIDGEGEWDPPGGWRPFRLDIETGRLAEKT